MPVDDAQTPDDLNDEEQASGADELLYSVGELLRAKQSKEAIAKLVEKFADDVPIRSKAQRHMIYLGHAVTLVLIVAIGVFGYFKIISSETCGALLGGI